MDHQHKSSISFVFSVMSLCIVQVLNKLNRLLAALSNKVVINYMCLFKFNLEQNKNLSQVISEHIWLVATILDNSYRSLPSSHIILVDITSHIIQWLPRGFRDWAFH